MRNCSSSAELSNEMRKDCENREKSGPLENQFQHRLPGEEESEDRAKDSPYERVEQEDELIVKDSMSMNKIKII